MPRITIYLTEELKAAVERTAVAQGRSEAEIVRRAIAAATAAPAHTLPRVPLFGSGDPTLAERVDEVLVPGFGETPRECERPSVRGPSSEC